MSSAKPRADLVPRDAPASGVSAATRRHGPRLELLRFDRAIRVQPALDRLLGSADRAGHLGRDPLELVHRYSRDDDRELVGLLASAVAYGRVDLFKPRLSRLLQRLGPQPSQLARTAAPATLQRLCAGFSYRMTGPDEVAALLFAAGRRQQEYGSLGRLARTCFDAADGHMREALDRFVATLWAVDLRPFTGIERLTRRLAHLVASPGKTSACKRLNLYVRWMVRGPDGVDLGLWDLPASALVIPLDTHVHRISRLLGLTRRKDLSWRTAEEITARLRHLDPEDPVKYDFALSHLGISGGCVSRRIEAKCGPCPLKPICRLWDSARRA
jgi:uncharacterized protein (TIGR02757 family)